MCLKINLVIFPRKILQLNKSDFDEHIHPQIFIWYMSVCVFVRVSFRKVRKGTDTVNH